MSTARGERRLRLAASREILYKLPLGELFELPGRPHVVYQIRSYASTENAAEAVQQARNDIPFLFKAFETGQIGPKRMAKMHGGKPRMATIHEYLDWTITAQGAQEDDELDFGGFRIVVILPRYVSHWPYPGSLSNREGKRTHPDMGAPLAPYPLLQTHGRPLSAATIRSGPGYLEIPFVATHESKRGRGYCRCLVEAVEDIARALSIPKLMLCSTNDPLVKSTWHHLGFDFTEEHHMEEWDIPHSDMVYLQNTTQMHKDVPPPGKYRSLVIKQGDYKVRTYIRLDKVPKRPRLHVPTKAPPKKQLTAHLGNSSAAARLTQGMAALHPFQVPPDGSMPPLGMGPSGMPMVGPGGPSGGAAPSGMDPDASWRSDMLPDVSNGSGGGMMARGGRNSMGGGMADDGGMQLTWGPAPAKGVATPMHMGYGYQRQPPMQQPPYQVSTQHPFTSSPGGQHWPGAMQPQPQPAAHRSGQHYPMPQQAVAQHPTQQWPSTFGPPSHHPTTISGLPPVSMRGEPPPHPYGGVPNGQQPFTGQGAGTSLDGVGGHHRGGHHAGSGAFPDVPGGPAALPELTTGAAAAQQLAANMPMPALLDDVDLDVLDF